jgi:hypothetical protein
MGVMTADKSRPIRISNSPSNTDWLNINMVSTEKTHDINYSTS